MSSLLHRYTPTVAAIDARGINVCTTRYHRNAPDAASRALFHRTSVDAGGRRWIERDARSVEVVVRHNSVSGTALASLDADAGLNITLYGGASESIAAWNGRGTYQRVVYDDQLRPIATFETKKGLAESCLERLAYGGPQAHINNGCLALLRHDDTAGTLTADVFSVLGTVVRETRRFLQPGLEPDWPESITARDERLEDAAYPTEWNYDATASVLIQRDARGNDQTSVYEIDGALKERGLRLANGSEHVLVTGMRYGAMGELLSHVAGNGVVSTARYDDATGRLRTLLTTREDGSLLQDLAYEYDPGGNVLAINDSLARTAIWRGMRSDGDRAYRYDTLYQLVAASGRENPSTSFGPDLPSYGDTGLLTPYSQVFEYDDAGNLATLRQVGAHSYTQHMAVSDISNRSLPWLDGMPEPDMDAAFDESGNQRSLQGGKNLLWNGRDELAGVTTLIRSAAANDEERYTYGANGARCRKIASFATARAQHTKDVRYLPGIELRSNTQTGEELDVLDAAAGFCNVVVLCWRSPPPGGLTNVQVRYQWGDHLGSVALEVDADALLISAEGYYPFGGTAWRSSDRQSEADYRTVRYSGKERDASGLYYYGFRYYAPWQLRWTQPDPAGGVDGPNRYLFVNNSPIGHRDSNGLLSDEVLLGVIVVAIAVLGVISLVSRSRSREEQHLPSKAQLHRKRLAVNWVMHNFHDTPMLPVRTEAFRTFAKQQAMEGRTSFARSRIVQAGDAAQVHMIAMTPDEEALHGGHLPSGNDLVDFANEHGLPSVSSVVFSMTGTPSRTPSGTPAGSRRASQLEESLKSAMQFVNANSVTVTKNRRSKGSSAATSSSSSTGTPSPARSPDIADVPLTFSARFAAQYKALQTTPSWSDELRTVDTLLDHLRAQGVPRETVAVPGVNRRTGSDKVPGFGHRGAGAFRLLTTGDRNERTIVGIGDPHHASGRGYGPPKWW